MSAAPEQSGSSDDYNPGLDAGHSTIEVAYEKVIKPIVRRKYFVSDTGRLDYSLMREVLRSIRERAFASGLSHVPVVLTNHPKDIRDWQAIDRFVGETTEAEDVKFVTLREVAEKLASGEFEIRKLGETGPTSAPNVGTQ